MQHFFGSDQPRSNRWLVIALGCVWLLAVPSTGEACKYSVRDVGFVDLGSEPYRLIYFYDGDAQKPLAQNFASAAKKMLANSNIKSETINVSLQAEHPALKYRTSKSLSDGPELVIVAAGREISPLVISSLDSQTNKDVVAQLAQVVASPLRIAIMDSILESYAVLVVVEGKSDAENHRVTEAAKFAIEQLSGIMQTLDKPVDGPPKMLTLTAKQVDEERLLLWSWGLDADHLAEPSVAILFGRGRQLGPVITGSDISGTELLDRLSLVGKSCECELDRSWMQGPMFPHAWDALRQADTAKVLGFDAENPLVKVEISRIIARGPRNRPEAAVVDLGETDPLLGYGEITIDDVPFPDDAPLTEEPLTSSPEENLAAKPGEENTKTKPERVPPHKTAQVAPSSETEKEPGLSAGTTAAVTIGSLLVIALGGGVFLFLRMRSQA